LEQDREQQRTRRHRHYGVTDPEDDFGEAAGDDWPQPGWAGRVRESSRDRSLRWCESSNQRWRAWQLLHTISAHTIQSRLAVKGCR
jgi:hypothetical protein